MMDTVISVLLWTGAIGCGLLGGLFFAFSVFIMSALGRIAPASGIAAMNAINRVILRSLFMPLFWATTLAALALGGIATMHWDRPGSAAMLVGGAAHVLGMFVCTVALNVPLNNALAAVDRAGEAALPVWQRYLRDWTRWNHVRTLGCTVASAMFVLALVERAASV
ncbi:anthrone oxygenase family protein [Lysobacter sp. CCNWLW3]|uniref:anthrone oxygenase family protein n=1 Tax=unclassified Lysobacter TaxID=2635362 RepID=UPI002FD10819